MNIIDKFQAKRVGVSEKRYNEADKIAQAIWKNLISEGKIINPFMHIRMPKSLMFIQLIFIIAMVDFGVIIYNKIFSIEIPETAMLVTGIAYITVTLIGDYMVYRHDIKQFEKYLEEIVKWEKAHGERVEKDYEGKRWGDLSPEDRKFLLSEYKLTDIDAWEKGEHKEFTGNGMCFVDLNAECCCINGIVHDGQLYINEDDVIVCL